MFWSYFCKAITKVTRMHFSRMRTARALTIRWGMVVGGCTCLGVYLPGGVPAHGGVPAWKVYLPLGCTVPAQGVYLPRWGVPAGGVPAGGYLPREGVPAWGGGYLSRGVYLPRGMYLPRVLPPPP